VFAAFHPDGDPGSADEADEISLAVGLSGDPSWLRLGVLDAAGAEVASAITAGSGASPTLSWDGRGDDGAVLPAGRYTLRVEALGAGLGPGAPCEAEVELRHRLAAPEGL
jgi:flagellar hook assembly protein FlgD